MQASTTRHKPFAGLTTGFLSKGRLAWHLFVWFVVFATISTVSRAAAAGLQDMFADRETITGESGLITGDNLGATIESGEPLHGGRTGGASVWISWVAPTNCIATFTTDGSSFDTVMAAYYVNDGQTPSFYTLHRAASDDDDHEHYGATSSIIFGALAGHRYEIAVDGYQGARGTIQLSWTMQVVHDAPPIVISTPNDQALQEGAPLTLSVTLENANLYDLSWYLNGRELENKESATLYIPSLSRSNLGQYKLKISVGTFRFFTDPVEIQINTEGQVDSLVKDKVYDTIDEVLGSQPVSSTPPVAKPTVKNAGPHIMDSVNRGYNGSQLFNTVNATAAPDEPAICGQAGAVTWLAYQPPENGTVMLDTAGSDIPVAIELFTYSAPLTNITQLESIACNSPDPNSTTNGLECAVLAGCPYIVGMVGIGDSRGVVKLNYQLDLTRLPVGPSVVFGGKEMSAAAGKPLVLAADAKGTPPLHFTWLKNDVPIPAEDSSALVISSAAPTDAGIYAVLVRNDLSDALSSNMMVHVLIPTALNLDTASGKLILSFDTVRPQSYRLEYRDPSGSDTWLPFGPTISGTDGVVAVTNSPPSASDAWFRVRVE